MGHVTKNIFSVSVQLGPAQCKVTAGNLDLIINYFGRE